MSLLKSLKLYHEDAKICPRHAVVAAMTESRVVPAMEFATEWIQVIAAVDVIVQREWLGTHAFAQIVVTTLFLLSLPLQGWYWLGQRAQTPLDPRLQHWYLDLAVKLSVHPHPKPAYLMLARLLRKALQELPPDQH